MQKLLMLFMVFIATFGNAMAQKTITGTVTADDGTPLPGVTVVVKGTSIGTVTNTDGEYNLTVPDNANTLVFSFIGLKTQEIEIGNQTSINVTMEQDVIGLEEVVAIGYGTVKKKDLTGAVAQIDAEKLEDEATSNITSMLRGSIPGLNVSFTRSAKGLSGAEDLLVRGQTSLRIDDPNTSSDDDDLEKANAPLIVVDGMIYYGDLADINPVDIEAFDVLKDASSAAIYGSRASNGVILITTKKGRKGKPTINVSASVGVAMPSSEGLDFRTGESFIDWRIAGFESNERHQVDIGAGYYNDPNMLPAGVSLDQWKAYDGSSASNDVTSVWLNRLGFSPIEITNYKSGKQYDWYPEFFQTGLTQDYNVSLSGGAEAVSYYFSMGYVNNEGIRYNENYQAIRSRLNLEATVNSWLKVGVNTQFAVRDESPLIGNNNYGDVNPFASYYEADGKTITFAPTGNVSSSRHPHPVYSLP